jgi:AcrR family transcriptional regulator
MATKGVRPSSAATKERILEAARALFSENGFDRTTIRLVAARAVIHPSLVMRYFGDKEGLFASAVSFDLRIPDLASIAPRKRGEFLARYFVKRWEGPEAGDELPALLRVAVTHSEGRSKLIHIFEEQLAPLIAKIVPRKQAKVCAALIATQALGMAFTRYVIQLPAVVSLSTDQITAALGETFQRYLDS